MHLGTKIFPFAEGVPYTLGNSKFIIPELNSDRWHYLFRDRISSLCLQGGFIENLFSLSYFEALNTIYSRHKMEWCGNSLFKKLNDLQGLAKSSKRISSSVLYQYPVPAFFNKNKTATFMNCLNNYIDVYTYYGEFRYRNDKALLKQLFNNLMIKWDDKYIPQLRRIDLPEKLNKLANTSRFDLRKKFVLLFPDITGWSDHNSISLTWGLNEVRSFNAMLSKTDYNLIIVSPYPQRYYGLGALIVPMAVDNIIYLIKESSFVLSKEPDFVLAGLFVGNTTPCALKLYNECCLIRNKKFVNPGKRIITSNNLTPMEMFEVLKWKK
jgi:hypothetical protein